ncbi:MAG TPA: DUF3054 domain-containing protein [Microbacteriaceae bacterium]
METSSAADTTVERGDSVSVRASVVWLAAAIDVVAVLVFVATGRSSHAEALSVAGLAETAWPFLGGALVGWLLAGLFTRGAWHSALALVRTGVVIWLSTVAIGMLLRVVSGQGTALAFIIVATVVLGILLVGWRALAILIRRLRGRRHSQQAAG